MNYFLLFHFFLIKSVIDRKDINFLPIFFSVPYGVTAAICARRKLKGKFSVFFARTFRQAETMKIFFTTWKFYESLLLLKLFSPAKETFPFANSRQKLMKVYVARASSFFNFYSLRSNVQFNSSHEWSWNFCSSSSHRKHIKKKRRKRHISQKTSSEWKTSEK